MFVDVAMQSNGVAVRRFMGRGGGVTIVLNILFSSKESRSRQYKPIIFPDS